MHTIFYRAGAGDGPGPGDTAGGRTHRHTNTHAWTQPFFGVQAPALIWAVPCLVKMADVVARMRVAKALLASFRATPGFTHMAASECEALATEIDAAQMERRHRWHIAWKR